MKKNILLTASALFIVSFFLFVGSAYNVYAKKSGSPVGVGKFKINFYTLKDLFSEYKFSNTIQLPPIVTSPTLSCGLLGLSRDWYTKGAMMKLSRLLHSLAPAPKERE